MGLGVPEGGGVLVRGQNALFEIAMKQYSGRLMILEWGGEQNALVKIARKQCLRLLMML